MQDIWLIRHAESLANAGMATDSYDAIALTDKGLQQAEQLANKWLRQPDLIICSPYLRAVQTAAALQRKYPNVPSQTWAIQEFTYLSQANCQQTTTTTRKPLVQAYWERLDVDYCDGETAESFADFIARARAALSALENETANFVTLFGHGQFMHAMIWLLWHKPVQIDCHAMQSFYAFMQAVRLPNTAIIKLKRLANDCTLYVGGIEVAHLA